MSDQAENFADEISKDDPFEQAIAEIKAFLSKEKECVLDSSLAIVKAYENFPGRQVEFAKHLDMTTSELNKRLRTGRKEELYDKEWRQKLPSSLETIYQLVLVKHLDDAFRDGAIRVDMTREEAKGLRKLYSQPRPWLESPPIQAAIPQAGSQQPGQSKKPKKWATLPNGVCVLVQMHDTPEQESVIRDCVERMREAGISVHDQWTIEEMDRMKATVAEDEEVEKIVDRAVRDKIKELKKKYRKKGRSKHFASEIGDDAELALNGGIERAREVWNLVAHEGEFDELVHDIRINVPSKNLRPTKLPTFPNDPVSLEQPEEILRDLDRKQKDYSSIDVSSVEDDIDIEKLTEEAMAEFNKSKD